MYNQQHFKAAAGVDRWDKKVDVNYVASVVQKKCGDETNLKFTFQELCVQHLRQSKIWGTFSTKNYNLCMSYVCGKCLCKETNSVHIYSVST